MVFSVTCQAKFPMSKQTHVYVFQIKKAANSVFPSKRRCAALIQIRTFTTIHQASAKFTTSDIWDRLADTTSESVYFCPFQVLILSSFGVHFSVLPPSVANQGSLGIRCGFWTAIPNSICLGSCPRCCTNSVCSDCLEPCSGNPKQRSTIVPQVTKLFEASPLVRIITLRIDVYEVLRRRAMAQL